MDTAKRIAAERATVLTLVRALYRTGCTVGYHDGEELAVAPGFATYAAIAENLHSTDAARLIVRREDDLGFRAGVALVFGNSPWEVFADWTDIEPLSSMICQLAALSEARFNV